MTKKSFYITTTLPYVNAEPHIGFAMEIIQADIIARWKESQGYEVFFNTGTDEHGQKVYKAALAENKNPQVYCDELAEKFKDLQKLLGLKENIHFIRTTDVKHLKAAQEMWKRCTTAGYIDKKQYKIKYCVGCELEKSDSELVDGRCPIHMNLELEVREEENYFFKFSQLGDKLLNLYKENPGFVVPDFRLNEMKALIDKGLEDFSISRLKSKMPWGVPVPGDDMHVMYVWFDALVSYISTLGWPNDLDTFNKFWRDGNPVQFAGKDQVRQQAAMWQAMLIAAGLPPSKHIVIHGFLNFSGQKMSKSLGNVISPQDVVDQFGTEALRYFVAREFNQFEDTDLSIEKLIESYNAHLANGLGNLVSRVMKMAEANLDNTLIQSHKNPLTLSVNKLLEGFEIGKAMNMIWEEIGRLDKKIQETTPFKLVKTNLEEGKKIIEELVAGLGGVADALSAFLPETSKKILDLIKRNKSPETPLFPRKD